MNLRNIFLSVLFASLLLPVVLHSQIYPDQHYVFRTDSIIAHIQSNSGIELSHDGKSIQLEDGLTSGYIVLDPVQSTFSYNRGLPSWNGSAPDANSSFMIQMRFPYGNGWSPWLTAGFWKSYIWSSYGSTGYIDGEIDYDYVKLDSYQNAWQFKIIMKRNSVQDPSPTLHKLSFFVSDSRTTDSLDLAAIINDNPQEIFIETILNQRIRAGKHSLSWNAAHLASGTYFIIVRTSRHQKVIRALLLK